MHNLGLCCRTIRSCVPVRKTPGNRMRPRCLGIPCIFGEEMTTRISLSLSLSPCALRFDACCQGFQTSNFVRRLTILSKLAFAPIWIISEHQIKCRKSVERYRSILYYLKPKLFSSLCSRQREFIIGYYSLPDPAVTAYGYFHRRQLHA